MRYLKTHLSAMFPFPTGSCSRVTLGAKCDLEPFIQYPEWEFVLVATAACIVPFGLLLAPFCALAAHRGYRELTDTIRVSRQTKTSFTFTVLNGPIGRGSTIRFKTGWGSMGHAGYVWASDFVYLDEKANAPGAAWWLHWVTDGWRPEQSVWEKLGATCLGTSRSGSEMRHRNKWLLILAVLWVLALEHAIGVAIVIKTAQSPGVAESASSAAWYGWWMIAPLSAELLVVAPVLALYAARQWLRFLLVLVVGLAILDSLLWLVGLLYWLLVGGATGICLGCG